MRKLWVNVDKDWQKGALVQITQLPLGGTKHGVGGQLPRLPRHQPVHNQPGVHHTRTQPLKTLLHHALKVRERTVLKQRLHKVRRRGFQSLRVVECTWTPQSSLWHKPLLTFVLYCCFALCFFFTVSSGGNKPMCVFYHTCVGKTQHLFVWFFHTCVQKHTPL